MAIGFCLASFAFGGISVSSFAARKIKDTTEYYSNKEFNELKIIEELECIEEDF